MCNHTSEGLAQLGSRRCHQAAVRGAEQRIPEIRDLVQRSNFQQHMLKKRVPNSGCTLLGFAVRTKPEL
eukprot:2098538-Amphidinium_carterae.1